MRREAGHGRVPFVNVAQQLARLGGVGSRRELIATAGRAPVDQALREGAIVRDGHGRYALPMLNGVASHRSTALWWGWGQKDPDHLPEVTVPRGRKVDGGRRDGVTVHWAGLATADVDEGHTSRRRTIVDCLRSLPFDEALAIADSALRVGSFTRDDLMTLAATVRGPGRGQCRRVAAAADGRSDNPFESVLRAIALDVPDLRLEPQVVLAESPTLRPDLVDRHRRLVVEADSFAWHGSRGALRRDCRRYNRLVTLGFVVLRFAWEDVMHDPAYVRAVLTDVVHGGGLPQPGVRRRTAA